MPVDLEQLELLARDLADCDWKRWHMVEGAVAEIRELRDRQAVPPWTRETPTVAGPYWIRDAFERANGYPGEIRYLVVGEEHEDGTVSMWVDGAGSLEPDWEYSGPIPGPKEE